MILPYQDILKLGPTILKPFDSGLINPASYDLTLHLEVKRFFRGVWTKTLPNLRNEIEIEPGEIVLASSLEYVFLPSHIAADLKLKSSIGRKFINHMLSGWIDPGFEGQITLELHNCGPKTTCLIPGQRIAQLVFLQLVEPTVFPYSGKYQKQKGPTEER